MKRWRIPWCSDGGPMNHRRVGEVLLVVMATAAVTVGAAAGAASPARHVVGITNITFTKTAVGSDYAAGAGYADLVSGGGRNRDAGDARLARRRRLSQALSLDRLLARQLRAAARVLVPDHGAGQPRIHRRRAPAHRQYGRRSRLCGELRQLVRQPRSRRALHHRLHPGRERRPVVALRRPTAAGRPRPDGAVVRRLHDARRGAASSRACAPPSRWCRAAPPCWRPTTSPSRR